MREWEFIDWKSAMEDPSAFTLSVTVTPEVLCEPGAMDCGNYGEPYFISNDLAGIGETCEGFNEMTGAPFPACQEGLVCQDAGMVSIPGAGNHCVEQVVRHDVQDF